MDGKGFDPKFDDNKETDILHVGKKHRKPDGSSYRKLEILINQEENYMSEKNREKDSVPVTFEIKDQIVLHRSLYGQQKIHCWLIESNGIKKVSALRFSRRTGKGVYGNEEITLSFDSMYGLKCFLDNLFRIDTLNDAKFKIPLSDLNPNIKPSYSNEISDDEFQQLIKANITSIDDFYSLLSIQK